MRWRRGNSRLGRGGNVLILVALAAVPLIGLVALAIDFGRTTGVKSALDLAADSAALLATTAASNAFEAGSATAIAQAITAATARFQAQSGQQYNYVTAQPTVTVVQNGGLFNSTVSYNAQLPTTFARVLGVTALPVSGQSSASLSLSPYVDVQILMDVSSSMTVAATAADIATMETLTTNFHPTGPVPDNIGQGCAFACHWSTTNEDYFQLAIANHVQLRITVLQNAVANLINTMATLDSANTYRLGLYTFSQTFNQIYPLSYNLTGGLPHVSEILPDVNFCSTNCPDTYFSAAMQQLASLDQASAQSSAQAPQRFLFLVTDGVYDQYSSSGQRQIGALNPADCTALKNMGISILVLYTPYLPLPTNAFYNTYVAPISSQIVPDLQACASSANYLFTATNATGITTQLQNMLQLVVQSTSHLTQ